MHLRHYGGLEAGAPLSRCIHLQFARPAATRSPLPSSARCSLSYGGSKNLLTVARYEHTWSGQVRIVKVASRNRPTVEKRNHAQSSLQALNSTKSPANAESQSNAPLGKPQAAHVVQLHRDLRAVGDPRKAKADYWRNKLTKSQDVKRNSKLQKNAHVDTQTWLLVFHQLKTLTTSTSQLLDDKATGAGDLTFTAKLSHGQKEEVRKFVAALLVREDRSASNAGAGAAQPHFKASVSWTKAMFAYAIYRITNYNPPRLQRQTVHHDNEWHQRFIAEKLNYVFGLPEFHQAVSVKAFAETIKYLLDTRQLPLARNILAKMEWFELSPTIGIFNRFFHSCAVNQNLLAFQSYLQKLATAKVTPDWKTWIAFLFISRDKELREVVIQHMESLGFFDNPAARARVAAAIVPDYFGPYIADGGRAINFISSLDAVLGPQWLTPHLSIYLFWELGKHGRILEGASLMTYLQARKIPPSARWLSQLIYHSRHHKNIVTSIWLVKHTHETLYIDLDADGYTHLFASAWNLRLANLARTIYTYACLSGHVSVPMENQLRAELPSGRGSTGATKRQFRREFLHVGLGALQPSPAPLLPLFQRGDAEQVMLRDFRAAMRLEARRPLHEMLVAALRRDMRWRRQGVRLGKGMSWKAVHVLRVPLRFKMSSKTPNMLGAGALPNLPFQSGIPMVRRSRRRMIRGRSWRRAQAARLARMQLSWRKVRARVQAVRGKVPRRRANRARREKAGVQCWREGRTASLSDARENRGSCRG